MTLRTVLLVILAIIFGGSAAVGINNLRNTRAQAKDADTVDVVVASVDINRGTTVTADMLDVRKLPKNHGLSGVLAKREDAVDRVAFANVMKGSPILDNNLAGRGAGQGLAALIPKGMRAFTIQTSSVAAGVAGLLLPGNKVDVLLTVNPMGGNNDVTGGGSTTTLLQNIEVLAVDRHLEPPADSRTDSKDMRSVTLLVTPDQAAKLDLGQNKGTIHLSLRHPEDRAAANTQPATLAELRFHQEKPWDERLRGVLDSMAKVVAAARPKTPPAKPVEKPVVKVVAPVPPPPPPREVIRTLRGIQDGQVILERTGAPAGTATTAANTR